MQIAVEDRLARVVGSAVFRTLFLGLMAIFAIWALKYYHHHYKYIGNLKLSNVNFNI